MSLDKHERRQRRHLRIRKRISGSSEVPRLCVHRTLKHIYAQIIDDTAGRTLAAASSQVAEAMEGLKSGGNREAAKKVGLLIARKAKEAGITKVVFDRGGYLYHGRVKDLADAAREGGLQF